MRIGCGDLVAFPSRAPSLLSDYCASHLVHIYMDVCMCGCVNLSSEAYYYTFEAAQQPHSPHCPTFLVWYVWLCVGIHKTCWSLETQCLLLLLGNNLSDHGALKYVHVRKQPAALRHRQQQSPNATIRLLAIVSTRVNHKPLALRPDQIVLTRSILETKPHHTFILIRAPRGSRTSIAKANIQLNILDHSK